MGTGGKAVCGDTARFKKNKSINKYIYFFHYSNEVEGQVIGDFAWKHDYL